MPATPHDGAPAPARWVVALLVLLLLALALRMGLALALPNLARADEAYQGLEPAYRLVTGWGVVTWEWRDGIRSWLLPGAVAGVMWLGRALGASRGALVPVAAALSVVSLAVVACGFALGWRFFRLRGALLCGFVCAVWPDLAVYAPKALTEVQAAHLLVVAATLAIFARDPAGPPRRRTALALGTGVLLGLSVLVRVQLAPAALLVAAWAGRTDARQVWAPMVAGGLASAVLGGAADALAGLVPFSPMWRNFTINIVHNKAAEYGVLPVQWYVMKLLNVWGAAAVPAFAMFLLGMRRVPLLAGVAVLVTASHSLIAHKELSFIYAAQVAAVLVVGVGTADAAEQVSRLLPGLRGNRVGLAAMAFWALTAGSMLASTYSELLTRDADKLRAAAWLHDRGDLCGAAYGPGLNWWQAGGYSQLDRPVPLSLFRTVQDVDRGAAAANYVVASTYSALPPPYARQVCFEKLCVYRRPGDCDPLPAFAINTSLERDGF